MTKKFKAIADKVNKENVNKLIEMREGKYQMLLEQIEKSATTGKYQVTFTSEENIEVIVNNAERLQSQGVTIEQTASTFILHW